MEKIRKKLLDEIYIVKDNLDSAYNLYNYASQESEIDYYAYYIKAYQCKFDSLLKKIKEMEKRFVINN